MRERSRWLHRIAEAVDRVGALLLGIVTALTFVAVVCRYVLNAPIPDGFDISRLLLGVAVFWGIAAASYRLDHVQVDLLWTALGRRGRRWLDLGAALVTLGFFALLTAMFTEKVRDTFAANEQTFDLRLPVWAFYALGWLGLAVGLVLLAMRVARLVRDGGGDVEVPDTARPWTAD